MSNATRWLGEFLRPGFVTQLHYNGLSHSTLLG